MADALLAALPYLTVIVPLWPEWIVQTYLTVPAFVSFAEYEPDFWVFDLSLVGPPVEMTLCDARPTHFQVTVVPLFTLNDLGLNTLSATVTDDALRASPAIASAQSVATVATSATSLRTKLYLPGVARGRRRKGYR